MRIGPYAYDDAYCFDRYSVEIDPVFRYVAIVDRYTGKRGPILGSRGGAWMSKAHYLACSWAVELNAGERAGRIQA